MQATTIPITHITIMQPTDPLSLFEYFLFSEKPVIKTYTMTAKIAIIIVPKIPPIVSPLLEAESIIEEKNNIVDKTVIKIIIRLQTL